MRYEILVAETPEKLTVAVEEYLRAGWKVLGGPIWCWAPSSRWAQAVVIGE